MRAHRLRLAKSVRHAGGLLPAVTARELDLDRLQPGMTRTKSAIIQMNSQSPATGRESL
jgi:hypothetical protein